jgi:hypothetical protein
MESDRWMRCACAEPSPRLWTTVHDLWTTFGGTPGVARSAYVAREQLPGIALRRPGTVPGCARGTT